MPPRDRRGNKKKNKNNNSPYQHPNQNQNQNHPILNNINQKNHNRGRSTSRARSNCSHSHKSYQRPGAPKHFQKPPATPSSPDSLASKATHTLRSTLFSSPTGISKRRISIGLSLTLPSLASSLRIKNLLLQAIDDARSCVGKVDFETDPSTPSNASVEVPACPGAPKGGWDDDVDMGFRDSGISMAMDTDIPDDDPWEMEQTPVSVNVDHGCVDIVREHGQLVQRMRWDATHRSFVEPPRGPRKMSGWGGGKVKDGRLRPAAAPFGDGWGDEVM